MPQVEQILTRTEEEILEYLRNEPGSRKADIVRYLRDRQIASKMTVFQYLEDLENKNMIYGKKERPNSQSIMMYVNEDHVLASVLGDLEVFKRAYYRLLQKSKERIDNKDYSEAAKLLDLKESDPVKWEDDDKARFSRMEVSKFAENAKTSTEFTKWYERYEKTVEKTSFIEALNEILKMEMKLRSETNAKQKNRIMLEMNKFLSNVEASVSESSLILDNMIQELYNVKNYEVDFLLWYAVFIYYWFVEVMTFYTIFVWPKFVKDKQIISSIYSIIFRIVFEIQSQLFEFYSNNKLSYETYSPTAIIAYYMKIIRDENLKPGYLYQYYALNMKSEIKSVANSLLKLNEKIKDYNLMDVKDFESIDIADRILEVDNSRRVFLEWIEKSKNIKETEIDSPEYLHQGEMAMQAVKKIIQLQTQK